MRVNLYLTKVLFHGIRASSQVLLPMKKLILASLKEEEEYWGQTFITRICCVKTKCPSKFERRIVRICMIVQTCTDMYALVQTSKFEVVRIRRNSLRLKIETSSTSLSSATTSFGVISTQFQAKIQARGIGAFSQRFFFKNS